jgi:hypothetical protein
MVSATIPEISFKALAHRASHLTVSGKAGLGAQTVLGELKAVKPTRAIAAMITGACGSNIAKAMKATPADRAVLATGKTRLADLTTKPDNTGPSFLDLFMSAFDVPADPPAVQPRLTVEDMFAAYQQMNAAERVAFARMIGVERCWQPQH